MSLKMVIGYNAIYMKQGKGTRDDVYYKTPRTKKSRTK
jgi:hypothetical protein